jgi:hypothetical protein
MQAWHFVGRPGPRKSSRYAGGPSGRALAAALAVCAALFLLLGVLYGSY